MKSTLEMPGGTPDFEVVEFFPKRTRYCICVTVLNEGDRLRNQLNRMQGRAELADIIIADGRSWTAQACRSFWRHREPVRFSVTGEPGLSTATRMGMAYTLAQGYEGMITIDGNGKDGVKPCPISSGNSIKDMIWCRGRVF